MSGYQVVSGTPQVLLAIALIIVTRALGANEDDRMLATGLGWVCADMFGWLQTVYLNGCSASCATTA